MEKVSKDILKLPHTWVLDVTHYDPEIPIWCPYDVETGEAYFGLIHIGNCPGIKYGVIHRDGQEALETFMNLHPEMKKYFVE